VALPVTLLIVWLIRGVSMDRLRVVVGLAVIYGVMHVLPWLIINRGASSGLKRFEHLAAVSRWSDQAKADAYDELRIHSLDERGDLVKALHWSNAALKVSDSSRLLQNHGVLLSRYGRVLFEQEQFEQAAECFWRAWSLDTTAVDRRLNYGIALLALGRLEEAEIHLEWVVPRIPDSPGARENLAFCYWGLGKYERARSELDYLERRGSPLSEKLRRMRVEIDTRLKPDNPGP